MEFLTALINGLSSGGTYAIIALGYTMVYGIAKMLNFAHGDIIMAGGYTMYVVLASLGQPLLAIPAAVLFCMILGVTIENAHMIKAHRIFPPKDFSKWARICEHIVRHYNEGWADGFEFGIEHWEIWNEPDGNIAPVDNGMWHGTKEQFFEFYKVAATYLKNRFGDKIKIGGYGSCGFPFIDEIIDEKELSAAYTTIQTIKWQKRIRYFKVFFEEFMDMIVKENVPLDFFSFHSYAGVKSNVMRQKYLDSRLEEYGLTHIETHLNEWNTAPYKDVRGKSIAAATAAANMCAMQNTSVTMLNYYDARLGASPYAGLFNPITYEPFCTYYSFYAF